MILKLRFWSLIFILPSLLSAQTISTDISTLSKGADVILTGRVAKQKSHWNKEKTRIYTEVTFEVSEYLKGGNNQASFSVVQPGGEVDGIGELYTHIPRFNPKEEVLLFAKKNRRNNQFMVFQGESGKIPLVKDPAGGELKTTSNKKLSALKEEIRKSVTR